MNKIDYISKGIAKKIYKKLPEKNQIKKILLYYVSMYSAALI